MERRGFITKLTAGTSALMLGGSSAARGGSVEGQPPSDKLGRLLPTRALGDSGIQVTMLGVGGYHVGWASEREAQEIIETAIEGGVRFFDTAESYQKGESERRYGEYLVPRYRDQVFIMTKTTARDAKTARHHLEGSLRRLKTDVIDLWQIHSIESPSDVENRLANGVLDEVLKAKAEGKVRFIGFTGHSNPEAHLRMLEMTSDTRPFTACQMPVNAIDPRHHSFVRQVLPEARERHLGVLAMKTLADGRFFALKKKRDKVLWESKDPVIPTVMSVRDALAFVWSLPVSVLITGAENASLLREKIDLARAFTDMSEAEREDLLARAESVVNEKVEYYKSPLS